MNQNFKLTNFKVINILNGLLKDKEVISYKIFIQDFGGAYLLALLIIFIIVYTSNNKVTVEKTHH